MATNIKELAGAYHMAEHKTLFLRNLLREAVLAELADGMSIALASRQTGISRPTIYAWMNSRAGRDDRNPKAKL